MIVVNIDGKNIRVFDEKFDGAKTLSLIKKSRTDSSYILDLLDRVIDGGADGIFRLLDPENEDPSIEQEVTPFITELFEKIGEANVNAKNSSGSQNSQTPASLPSEPTCNDTTESTSMTPKSQ